MSAISKELMRKLERLPQFDRKVYLACSTIPKGEVRTYGWIAKTIGHPRASRAVGSSLAKNPFAPEIPCHRVIRSDGGMGGYSGPGGIRGKKFMLLKEGFSSQKSPKKVLKGS